MAMSLGMRVLRGPDWDQNETDGGEGHLGTVVGVKAKEGTAEVVWDNGQVTTCRVGKEGKYDLRIYDSATVGVQHHGVTCKACRRPNIYGTRWRCTTCSNFDLCSQCYVIDAHSVRHEFERFAERGQRGERVGAREDSFKLRLMGIFPEARVSRGRDWQSGDVDGGPDGGGIVVEVVSPESGSARNAVRVSWDSSGQSVQHRLGLHGKVDLVCTEEAPGPACYLLHLPVLTLQSAQAEPATVPETPLTENSRSETHNASTPDERGRDSKTSRNQADAGNQQTGVGVQPGGVRGAEEEKDFALGEKVKIGVDSDVFKDIQRQASSWTDRMSKCIGRTGTVRGHTLAGEVLVEFAGDIWRISPIVLIRSWDTAPDIQEGDRVRILSDLARVQELQRQRAGWVELMAKTLGKVGEVRQIDSDGDYRVDFGGPSWVYHPLCCQPAPGCPLDFLDSPQSASSGADLLQGISKELLETLTEALGSSKKDAKEFMEGKTPLMQLFKAVSAGDLDRIRTLLDESPELVHKSIENGTALHFAAFHGRPEVLRLLVDRGADVNALDKDDDTPIMRAIDSDHARAVEVLVELGADVNTSNENGQTALHRAVTENSPVICRFLLDKGASATKRDMLGETALFDAVEKGDISSDILELLIQRPDQDLRLTNRKGFNVLHVAALKDRPRAVERLLSRDPGLVHTRMEEKHYRAIHIAAINNHTQVLRMLIRGESELDPRSIMGQTPLHLACEERHLDSARMLLEHGADIQATDKDGDTPLHTCLQATAQLVSQIFGGSRAADCEARLQLAQVLLERGARTDVRNRQGKTPLDVASSDLRERLQRLLQSGGAGGKGADVAFPTNDVTSGKSRVPTNEGGADDARSFAHPSNADSSPTNADPSPTNAEPSPTNAEPSGTQADSSAKECKVQ